MEIVFSSMGDVAKNFYSPPKPASQFLPSWYKDMPSLSPGEESYGLSKTFSRATNATLKHCSPFLDALTSGYIWAAEADIEIRKEEDGNFYFGWRSEQDLVTSHSEDQHPGLPPAIGGQSFVMKWSFSYHISTPRGYSTLFMHPSNRNDLPFRTFSGIVDTDMYPLSVQFPFQLLGDQIQERYIIEQGTPLVQMMPFKRDNWNSKLDHMTQEEVAKKDFDYNRKIVKHYKSKFWTKKKFK